MTVLSSRNGKIEFGTGMPTLLINDQLRVMDQTPDVLEQLRAGKIERMLELARRGQQVGTDMVDILVQYPDLDEASLLPQIAEAVHREIGCPISLDSRDPEAIEKTLRELQPYKPLINSVSAEKDVLDTLLPLAAKYGAAVVGMPIGDLYGLPKTAQERLEEAQVIVDAALSHGIPREDVVMDAICLASSVEPDSFSVTAQTLRLFKETLGVSTVLGIGNAGHGMPTQLWIDLAYLTAAVPWGLDAAYVNPETPGLIETIRAVDFLTSQDLYGKRYIQHYRAKKRKQDPSGL